MSHATPCDARDADRPDAGRDAARARIRRIERNADGQLVVHLAGRDEPLVDARLARYFPWSMPEAYISVLDADGREVAMLKTLDGLDDATRTLVEAELKDKVFNPKITRVLKYKREFGISMITAETDRGEVIFQFNGRHDVRLLSPTRALIQDVDGNTYEVQDFTQLDPASRKHLHPFF